MALHSSFEREEIDRLIAIFDVKLGPHDPFSHGLTSNLRNKLVAGPYLRGRVSWRRGVS